MINAIADVKHDLPLRAAPEKYGVMKSTLYNKCHDLHNSPIRGRPTKLTPFEESVLVSLAKGHETFGRPYNPHTFLQLVRQNAAKKCKPVLFVRHVMW